MKYLFVGLVLLAGCGDYKSTPSNILVSSRISVEYAGTIGHHDANGSQAYIIKDNDNQCEYLYLRSHHCCSVVKIEKNEHVKISK